MKLKQFFYILFCISAFHATGQTQLISRNSKYEFIENKGQIYDQNFKQNNDVKYLLPLKNGMNIQLRKNGFSYDTYYAIKDTTGNSNSISQKIISNKLNGNRTLVKEYQFNRIDVELIGANANPEIIAEETTSDYLNFYNCVTGETGVTHVRQFGKVSYKNIYPGIDMVFVSSRSEKKPVEYSFIVHPGADPNIIKLKYIGATKAQLINDEIKLTLSHGVLSENIPGCWVNETNEKVNIGYKEINNCKGEFVAEFLFPDNIKKKIEKNSLIIDPIPNLEWGTYYGYTGDEYGWSIITDTHDNPLITGSTTSISNIATTGAQQTTLGGLEDVMVVKMNSNGFRIWGTYYGGNGEDVGYSIKIDKSSNLIVTGITSSPNAIASPGAYQNTFGGDVDAFLLKLDSSGIRQWCTYYGGAGLDDGNGVVTDDSSNIYLVGDTYSTTNISSPGSHQIGLGGDQDVFIAKFNAAGIRLWGTYYGGTLKDWGYSNSISIDKNNKIYISGYTASTSSIATVGSFQSSFSGGVYDAFLAKFDRNGVLLWSTYYGGGDDDGSSGIASDNQNNVYITGSTLSPGNISTTGSYQEIIGGSVDAYIAKFDSNGVRQWGTYFGGSNYDAGYCINTDINNNIYMGGSTKSINNIATAGAYQTTYAGGTWDAYAAKFDNTGALKWCTYYGGGGDDYCFGITSLNGLSVYITGETFSTTGIATPGAYQDTCYGGAEDAYIAKFSDCSTVYGPDNITGIDSVCAGGNQNYSIAPVTGATSYTWSVPIGTVINSGQDSTSINVTFGTSSGNISVTATSICGMSAPAIMSINVFALPIANAGSNDSICKGDSINMNASGGNHYLWVPSVGLSDTSINNPLAFPSISTTYTVTVSNVIGCSSTDAVNIKVLPLPDISCLGNDTIVCVIAASMPTVTLSCPGFVQYLWTSSTGGSSSLDSVVIDNSGLTLGLGIKTVTLKVTDNKGCTNIDSIHLSFINCESVEEFGNENNLIVYPNPSSGKFNVVIPKSIEEIKIYNSIGQILESIKPESENNLVFDVVQNGVYFIQIITKRKTITKKLIVCN